VWRRDTDAVVVLARGDTDVASWPLVGCGRPDLALVDGLARLQLAAQHLGCSIRLREAGAELVELLDLCGLGEALLRVEVGGEPEGGEQRGVDEVVVPDDPVA
jgi:hypothetical protein